MIIYRLSSPYLHDAKSPFSIDQERRSLERKSVLLQSPGFAGICPGRDTAPEMGKEARHQKVKYRMLTSSTYNCTLLTWNDVLRGVGEIRPSLD